jgi:tetratricopeptide (TPR) repeat protein
MTLATAQPRSVLCGMTQFRLKLLGTPAVMLAGQALEVGVKPTLLLSFLVLNPAQANQNIAGISRDQIAQWLWGNRSSPLGNLSSALNKLREQLGKEAFETDERSRSLTLRLQVQCDVLEVLHEAKTDEPKRWETAWSIWPETFLSFADPHWESTLDPECQDWIESQRETLQQSRRELAVKLALNRLERHDWTGALSFLESVQPEDGDPRENLVFFTMLVHTVQGKSLIALKVYQKLEAVLLDLGGQPGADTRTALEIARESAVAAAKGLLEELFPIGREAADMPFVGRSMELELMNSSLPISMEGRAHAIVIRGEPGAGKTEFARRLMRRLDPTRQAYLYAEGFGERHAPAWRAFDMVVRHLVRARRHELESMGSELKAALARFVPDLLEDADSRSFDDERLLFLAIRWLLTHPERPTLLFLDDIQWIDGPSLGLVLELLRKPPPRGLILLTTWRDTEIPNTEEAKFVSLERLFELIRRERLGPELTLESLDQQAIQELISDLDRPADVEWLQKQTGGNPLYLLEMIEANHLEPGVIPPKLETLVQARIKGLPNQTSARQVLEVCAVLGEGATLGEVRTVTGLSFEETVETLSLLRESRLLRRGDATVSFNHDLIAQASLQLINPERSQLLNLRAAQTRRHQPERAAVHYWAAMNQGLNELPREEMLQIADAFGQAAMSQSLRGDPAGGSVWFDHSLRFAPDATSRVVALTRRARVNERLERYEAASNDLKQANQLSTIVDPITRAGVLNAQGLLLIMCFGDADGCEQNSNTALSLLEGLEGHGVLIERANALNNLGVAAWQRSDLESAEAHHRQSLSIRTALGDRASMARSHHNIALVLTRQSDGQAREHFEAAIELLERIGDRAQIADAYTNLSWLEWRLGNLDAAEKLCEQALEAAQPWGEEFNSYMIYNNLGAIRFLRGHHRQARDAYSAALATQHASLNKHNRATFNANLAEVELRLGLLTDAQSNIEQALLLLSSAHDPALEANIWWYSGEASALTGDKGAALEAYQSALILARTAGKRVREAESLARIARLEQDRTLAEQAITIADTPVTRANQHVLTGGVEEVFQHLIQVGDAYEVARFAADLFLNTGNATWMLEAQRSLEELRNAASESTDQRVGGEGGNV